MMNTEMLASTVFCHMSLPICSYFPFSSHLCLPHVPTQKAIPQLLRKSLRKDRPHSDFPQEIVKSLILWLFVQHIALILLRLVLSVLEHH